MIRFPRSLAKLVLYLSLILIFVFLIWARPPIYFYSLPLVPIALAALLYEFVGGTLVALAAMAGLGVLTALDSNAARRALILQEVWPILGMYLAAGPVIGWLAMREREHERRLVSAARRLHVVQDIAQAINTSLDLEQILQTIIAETRRLVPFENAAVVLREADSLRVVAVSEGLRRSTGLIGQEFALKGTAAGWSLQQRRIWTGGPADVARYPDTLILSPPQRYCLIIPLQFQSSAIGAFVLSGKDLAEPSQADLDNLTQIVGQMAIAIEHARLFEGERQQAKHLAAINEACREIAASLDLERTLKVIMDKAVETLPMDAGALFQFNLASQTYQVAVSHNLSPDYVTQITFAFEEGVPGWVVKHRRPLLIPDATRDVRVHPYIVAQGVRSVLATPLIARERLLGILNLYCKTQTHAFDDEAIGLAEVFAAQAAIALENARLVDELRRAAAELEARVEERTRQLRDTQTQVIRAEKLAAVGRLAASVAHEVNNPLQAIALQLQLIGDQGLTEAAGQRLAIAQEELVRIAGIVQRLLDFQRPTMDERRPHQISTLLDDVLALTGKQLQQHNIATILEGEAESALVLVAGNRIKQVFLNLILNAVEAMPAGGQLQVSVRQVDGMVDVVFSDSGSGMACKVMDHLFEPFFSTKTNGTGLGLAVSHEIIAQHGGRLEASSRPGCGAIFTVKLPVCETVET